MRDVDLPPVLAFCLGGDEEGVIGHDHGPRRAVKLCQRLDFTRMGQRHIARVAEVAQLES